MADNPYTAWDDTDASNAAIDGNDIAEDCVPAGINDALRAWRGSSARLLHSLTGQKVTTGTADVQVLSTGQSIASAVEMMVAFTAGSGLTNTGAMTLAVDSFGAKSVKVSGQDGSLDDPWAGAVSAGSIYLASYDSGAGVWVLLNPSINLALLAAKSQDDQAWYGLFRGTVADGTYLIVINATRAGTITNVTTKAGAGTATATVKVNTTALGGTANSVSTSEQTQAHSSSNTFAVGDDINIVISSASGCTDLSFNIEYTESLD